MKKFLAIEMIVAGTIMSASPAQALDIKSPNQGATISNDAIMPALSIDQLTGEEKVELRRSSRHFRGRHFRSGRHFRGSRFEGRHFKRGRSKGRHFNRRHLKRSYYGHRGFRRGHFGHRGFSRGHFGHGRFGH